MITWRPRAYSASSARAGGGALVVEAGEDAVADERQQLARTALEQLQAQGEKQLVASAFAGALSADGPEPGEGAPRPPPSPPMLIQQPRADRPFQRAYLRQHALAVRRRGVSIQHDVADIAVGF